MYGSICEGSVGGVTGSGVFGFMLLMPVLGLFMCPFAVAGDLARYFLISSLFTSGIPLS